MKSSDFTSNAIEAAVRLGLLLLLATLSFRIVAPFIVPVIWGVILAVAIYPLFVRLKSVLGGRNNLAAIIYTLLALAILITPTVMIANSIVETSGVISERYEAGTLNVPPPNDSVKEWPVIGEKTYAVWLQASENLEATFTTYKEGTKTIAKELFSLTAGAAGGILKFIVSIIISGVLVANGPGAYNIAVKFFSRVTHEGSGKTYVDLAQATIRSVAQGVLGIATIQAVMSALGMMVMAVPGWGLWSLLVLVVAIAQLPPILVLGFVSAYVFSVAETTPAVIFLVYCLIVSSSDGLLKPLFLGRGMSTPMLVILLGAIGGMLMSGIIGLFVGAIILALCYELFIEWLDKTEVDSEQQSA